MRVFDFDNTLFKGESVFSFAIFVMKKKKSLIRYIPGCVRILFLYKRRKMDIESFTKKLEKYTTIFLENREFIESLVEEFWILHIERLYPHMLKLVHKEDIIITSSPDFLISSIKDLLNTDHILCTKLDLEKGKILDLNFQENKVKNFNKYYKGKVIDEFYTDSYNDQPLMDISKSVFLVKNGVCKKIK